VRRVLETHGHWDHIGAVPAMREAGYEVAVTALDAPMLKDVGYDVFLEHTVVMPGHGVDTTIGNERPHLAEWVERGW
jgi:glyoxylase-like metal-dependent hydrolase (beta-lactamase superfamily II)